MKQFFLAIVLAMAIPSFAIAQPLAGPVPSTNGTLINPTINGGSILGSDASAANITATGASKALTTAALAAQQGVLLDAFRLSGDADDTAAMTRAVAAGVPILLGPRTYLVHDYIMSGTPANFVLVGVPGKSIIQRTSASGSQWFDITATNVMIDGVIFDMNKAAVTANQWGVFIGSGGQTINIARSVFKNNSGSLGSCLDLISTGPAAGGSFTLDKIEVTGCSFNPLYLGSVSNGQVINSNFHDNSTTAVNVQGYGAATTTNYSTRIRFAFNTFSNNAGSGLGMGSYAPPYVYGNPAATFMSVVGNIFRDNSNYQLSFVNTQHILVEHNQFIQSSSGVSVGGGIDCPSSYLLIQNNDISMPSAGYGIDCGGAIEPSIHNNLITMGARGAAVNIGGAQNGSVANNHLDVSGTAAAVVVYDVESDGSPNGFPYHASNITIQNNDIQINGSSAMGVQTFDNAGATTGALPINVVSNRFVGVSGATASQDVNYFSAGSGITVNGNTHNGLTGVAVNLNGSNNYLFDTVYDVLSSDLTANASVTSLTNNYMNAYFGQPKILFVVPTSGGSGYTNATTLSASGGCTWAGTPLLSAGVIIGVRTSSTGTGCNGSTVISTTDSGGGSGATFAVTTTPTLPSRKTLTFLANATQVIQTSGGAINITGVTGPMPVQAGTQLFLRANGGGSTWQVVTPPSPVAFPIGSLPTCNTSYNGAIVNVTGSTSGKWQARCNSAVSNWIAPDGTTIN